MPWRMLGGAETERSPNGAGAGDSRTVGTGRRRALPGGRPVVGAFLVAVAAVAVFTAALAGASKPEQTWVVAARPLGAGTVLGPADVMLATMRLSPAEAAMAFRQPAFVEGQALAVGVPAGALIDTAVLAPTRQQPVRRPVSVAVDPVSLAGLYPGQSVDVLTTQGSGSGAAVTVVVRGASLLQASQSSSQALAGGGSGEVTIGVATLAEVEAVIQAAHAGTISLVAAEPSDGVGAGPGPGGS